MQINKWLRYVVLAGIFLLPLIPLIIAKDMFFPFITGKNFAFRIIVEIIFAAWIVLAWRDSAYRPQWSWVLGATGAFVGVMGLATIFSEDPLRSFWSNFERMEGFVTTLHLFAYFLVAGSVLATRKLWWWFANTSLGVSAILSVYTMFQLAGYIVINQGGVRIDATFGNATYLAAYALFHIFIALILLTEQRGRVWLGVMYGAVIALNFFMLFNTATRGALLGFMGGVLVVALLLALLDREHPKFRKITTGVLLGIVLFIGGFFLLRNTEFIATHPVLSRFSNITLEAGSARFKIWGVAWEGVKEHPVLGWGQDNFILPFSKYYDARLYGEEAWFDRAHNVFMDWLVAGGFLGLFAYLSMFAAALYCLWFYRREKLTLAQKSIFTGLFAAYFFQNLFVFDNITSYLLFFGVLAFIHRAAVEGTPSDSVGARPVGRGVLEHLVPVGVIVGLLLSLYGVHTGIRTARAIIDGIDTRPLAAAKTPEAQMVALQEMITQLENAVRGGYLGRAEAREQLVQFASQIGFQINAPQIRESIVTLAEEEMKKQIEEAPGNTRYQMFLGSLYARFGRYAEAATVLEEARAISPKKQHLLYVLLGIYANTGDYEKAVAVAKVAWEVAPENMTALETYAAALIYARRVAEAEALLEKYHTEHRPIVNAPLLVNAYVTIGRFDRVVALWEAQAAKEPLNAQHLISLAAAYMELGRATDAIHALERAIAVDPAVKSQADYWISELKAGRKPR
ncbi:MAG: O-antigen ligase family protein [Parcubacteria group bacterium]|nr:O-antigen ligase family protein [Parcubacteria group bacterium]